MKFLGVLGLVLLSGCSAVTGMSIGKPPAKVSAQDGPPLRSVDVSAKPMPTPVAEPRIRRGNVSPYRVFGVEYQVMPSAEGYQEIGTASWYGRKFHGRLTSSGEPYDMFEFTAAHKTLPIPSYLRVTNLANGEQVIVRVNDRGPFAKNRIIDLSWAAAKRIGYDHLGTARVQLDILTHPDMAASEAKTAAGFLQIASV
ncbi:MAG: septal ring lytic transglycosylase RlpA family protein, partial [Litorivicinus sp.]